MQDSALKKAIDKLEELVKDCPIKSDESTGGDNARYGAVLKTGELRYNSYPCHAHMKNYSNAVVVFSQFVHHPCYKDNPDPERAYFDWIMSEDESPWRSMPKGYGDRDFNWTYGFIWDDLTKNPSNLQHSFLTATRMPKEWPSFIKLWYKWAHEYGINKALAYYFVTLFTNVKKPAGYIISRINKYDWPLDVATTDESYLVNFVRGKTEALNKPFCDSPVFTPVNRIFGDNTLSATSPKVYGHQLFLRYSPDFGLKEPECEELWSNHVGSLGYARFNYSTHWLIQEEELIQIMKLEEKRLKL